MVITLHANTNTLESMSSIHFLVHTVTSFLVRDSPSETFVHLRKSVLLYLNQ